jgi:outer membrane murein-binding lipoprotein Lpp
MQIQDEAPRRSWPEPARWSMALLVLVLCVAVAGGYFFVREHTKVRELATTNQSLNASLNQLQSQLQAMAEKLNTLSVQPAQREPAESRPASAAKPHTRAASRRMVARRAADDPRWRQVQSQLSEQQKQLASTREDVDKTRDELGKTRDDLSGRLSSTRDELNGSIARTHEDLVALQKRGERNYYEFQLDKSKRFERVGPISLSLRKVNYKHKAFNLVMMVDDFQLDKKNVNLYEPVLITLSDRPQPLELVINHVEKNEVKGYLSEPKYKKSELTASAAQATELTPAATAPANDKTPAASAPR